MIVYWRDGELMGTSWNHKHASSCKDIARAVYAKCDGAFDQVKYLYMRKVRHKDDDIPWSAYKCIVFGALRRFHAFGRNEKLASSHEVAVAEYLLEGKVCVGRLFRMNHLGRKRDACQKFSSEMKCRGRYLRFITSSFVS